MPMAPGGGEEHDVDTSEITDEDLSGPKVDRRTATKLFGSVAAAAGLAGCAGGGGDKGKTGTDKSGGGSTDTEASGQAKMGGSITAGWNTGEITNLDPTLNSVGVNEQVSMNVFNALLRTTPKLEIVPDAAKDWKVENGGKDYTFTLREGMKFQKGYGEVTAKDVKYTIMRGLTTDGSVSKPKLTSIAEPYKDNVVVEDKYTLKIHLSEPFIPFLKFLTRAGGAANIIPKKAVEEKGRQGFKTKPVGAGPFEVADHEVGQRILLKSFDEYWETDDNGNQLPYLDEVTIKPLPEASTLVSALKAGDVQMANYLPLTNLKEIRKSDKVDVSKAASAGWIGLVMNFNKKPFSSKKARQAIAHLINQEEFVKQAYFGNNDAALGPIGPGHGPFYRKEEEKPNYQSYDKAKGEKLLEESGMKGESWDLLTEEGEIRTARVLKNQLDDYFDISIESVDSSTYWDRYEKRNENTEVKNPYDATISGSDPDLSVDTTLYFFFKSPQKGGAFNDTGYSNDKVDQWLNEQRKTADQDKRADLIHKIEDQVMKDASVAFTHHTIPWQATSTSVTGYEPHLFRRDLWKIRKK